MEKEDCKLGHTMTMLDGTIHCKKCGELIEIPIKGTFQWAIAQMQKGKKVRRPLWGDTSYIRLRGHTIEHSSGGKAYLTDSSIMAVDWVVVEEEDYSYLFSPKMIEEERDLFSPKILKLLEDGTPDEEFKKAVKVFGEVCQNILKKKREEKQEFYDVLVSALHDLERGKGDIQEVLDILRKAIKDFVDFLEAREKSIEVDRHTTINQKAKEIFGERLLI